MQGLDVSVRATSVHFCPDLKLIRPASVMLVVAGHAPQTSMRHNAVIVFVRDAIVRPPKYCIAEAGTDRANRLETTAGVPCMPKA
jgi:hypothetical protein